MYVSVALTLEFSLDEHSLSASVTPPAINTIAIPPTSSLSRGYSPDKESVLEHRAAEGALDAPIANLASFPTQGVLLRAWQIRYCLLQSLDALGSERKESYGLGEIPRGFDARTLQASLTQKSKA